MHPHVPVSPVRRALRALPLASLLVAAPAAAQPAAPNAATLEQALDRKLQKLKPSGMTERNVLFQAVRAGSGGAGGYPFQVTLLIRDYGPGYPSNRYYGETCVAHMDQQIFTLVPDGFGGWDVQGRLTPDMESRTCKANPAAGASSMPLAQLTGTPAPSGDAVAPAPAAPGVAAGSSSEIAQGAYECWANGEARPLMNFTVRGGGLYVGSDGARGAYRVDPSTSRVLFAGGALDGVMPPGFFAVYHAPGGRPTVSFRGRSGAEAAFCQRR
jgi:hypothetical protein